MSWSELNTRLNQEFTKHLESTAYSTGLLRTELNRPVHIKEARGNFFFAKAGIPQILDLVRQHLPAQIESMNREADEICHHRFSLLGYTALDYGRTIDWHLDAVSGRRAPLKPWFKIHYLDFNEVGDHKVIWELNRHQHLVTLAKAWLFTRNQGYVNEIVEQFDSWWNANPYPIGINWASTLEVAFRSLSWLWLRELLADCDCLPAGFFTRLLNGLAVNGRYIERYLSTYFSPNTHLLGEAVGLFFIGTLCPQFPAAQRWQKKGWEILLQEIDHQVQADGVYFEQALYYHVYALDFFLHARILAACNGIPVPPEFDDKLKRMLRVLATLAQAGPPQTFGDDDGGRVFDPRRNRVEHLSDPLALGATLYKQPGHAERASLTEESIWLFGEAAVRALYRSDEQGARKEERLQLAAFPASGVYVMADRATQSQVFVDAGPQGTGRCGHGHADALQVQLNARGRPWLVDSGTYCYVSNSGERDRFRGTAAHNTMRIDSRDQAIPDGPFAWAAIPKVTAERWIQGESFDFLIASHNGYARLEQPVTHRRYVFRLAEGITMVRDVAEGIGTHKLEIFWHFAPGLELSEEATGFVARPSSGGAGQLAVFSCMHEQSWVRHTDAAEISLAYGQKCEAPCVSFSSTAKLPADFAVLLLSSAVCEPLGELVSLPRPADGIRMYRYQSRNLVHHFVFSSTDAWKAGSWASDARFMYYCLKEGQLAHLILVDGGFANWLEIPVVKLSRKVDRFERIQREAQPQIFCSETEVIQQNFEGRLICFETVVRI